MKTLIFTAAAVLALSGCNGSPLDSNAAPRFGASGAPSNCRAYVQVAIDGYRRGDYSAAAAMAGLERNCGATGYLWGYKS